MSKFNVVDKRGTASGPLRTVSAEPTGVTHEGGTGYQRDAQSELFLRATTMFAGEDAFYEKANQGAQRFRELIGPLAVNAETWPWVKSFLRWLRGDGNIRTASILLAAEAVHARLAAGKHGDGNRELIASVLQRADEPGEFMAYWLHRFGRVVPKPVKRGVSDAVNRLYTERGFLRYDSAKRGVRMGDVLNLTHPSPRGREQAELFPWILDAQYGNGTEPPVSLRKVRARWDLSRFTSNDRHAFATQALIAQNAMVDNSPFGALADAAAGQWEWVLSWLGDKPKDGVALSKADQWRLVLPSMGYMALIRNLRNLDEAGLDDKTATKLAARIADPDEVARSRQLPFRFYSAHVEAPSLRWGHALDTALTLSLRNIPTLKGRTAVLIDTSASMGSTMSNKSKMELVTAAAIFGMALKLKNFDNTHLWGFADGQFEVTDIPKGMSLLKAVEAFRRHIGFVGHGTQIADAVNRAFHPDPDCPSLTVELDRVIILTDMQTFPANGYRPSSWGYGVGDVSAAAPPHVPVYAFNVAGYTNTAMPVVPGNNRHELGGLTDATFGSFERLEAGRDSAWPWEK